MKFDLDLKRWWYEEEDLFVFNVNISLLNFYILLNFYYLNSTLKHISHSFIVVNIRIKLFIQNYFDLINIKAEKSH